MNVTECSSSPPPSSEDVGVISLVVGEVVGGGEEEENSSNPDCLSPVEIETRQQRRVYPASFKLQVLDSYRFDEDCKGNQRATARKFGIHRRQIQKWLHAETDLRQNIVTSNMIDEEEPIALNLCIKSSNNDLVDEVIDVETTNDFPQDLSGFCRLQDQQTPSPSTSSVSGKRRSFTLQFKLDVLDAFYSNPACKGNQRATARLFGINRRQVQKWLCQEVQLRSEAALCSSSEIETSAKRQRLGRWLWNVPQWTTNVHWNNEETKISIPNLLPPQDTALCLKVEKSPTPPPQPSIPHILSIQHLASPLPPETTTEPAAVVVVESPKPKRHSYPLDFKLQALDAYHEDLSCRGNQRAVAKRFCIHRRQVQKWLKQEQQLRQRLAMGTKERAIRSPAVLKPMQMLTQQSTYSWVEELRAPAPCWS